MSEDINYADIAELRRQGYIQEANRLFFHQRGLAIEVHTADPDGGSVTIVDTGPLQRLLDGSPDLSDDDLAVLRRSLEKNTHEAVLGGVWDYRADPEGMCFSNDQIDPEKAIEPALEAERHREAREALFSSDVQPLWDMKLASLPGGLARQTAAREAFKDELRSKGIEP